MSKSNIQKPIRQVLTEERALAILRFMSGDLGGVTNERVLAHCLELYGLPISQNDLRTQLSSLESIGVIRLERVEDLLVVFSTRKGSDIAKGIESVDGIAECGPECPY